MGELRFAAAILFWGLLPGFVLLTTARVRWSLPERVAAAPGLSLVAVACAAYAAEILHLPVAPLPVAAVLAALAGIVWFIARRSAAPPVAAVPEWPFEAGRSLVWLPWLVLLAPLAVVWQLEVVWKTALLPPSLHDGLDHANWYRLIFETQSLNPREVAAPPLGPSGEPVVYPWGMHAWAALVARASGMDPVAVFMRAMVWVSAALPLSVYALAAHFTGRGWTALAAALFSLVFWWLPYQVWSWGGYALLAGAIAALPAARLALAAMEARHAASMLVAAVAMGGLLVVHPSQLFVTLIIAAVVSMTLAVSGLASRTTAAVFAVLVAAAVGSLAAGGMLWPAIPEFLQRAREASDGAGAAPPGRWPLTSLFASQPPAYRTGMAVLSVMGAVAAAMNARLRPIPILYGTFVALVLLAREQTWLTALWYHLPERIWYAQTASQPLLAAAGVGWLLALAARAARRWVGLPRWQLVLWPLALWAVFTPLHEAYQTWARWRLYYAVHRNPNLAMTEREAAADFAWMRANIPAGEVLFNAPADWGVALPFTGHRTVFWSGGYAFDPATPWHDWLMLSRLGDPHTSQAGAELSARGVRYVYAGRLNPAMERRGRQSLDAARLREADAFTTLYESATATVLRVADVRPSLVGLHNSSRIRYDGFHPIEEEGSRRWRWTSGSSRILLTTPPGDASECFVRVLGPHPDAFELRQGDAALAFTPRGHRVPGDRIERPALALEIASASFVPEGGDPRTLGVKVTDVGMTCQP
jgi:hypothetical protein